MAEDIELNGMRRGDCEPHHHGHRHGCGRPIVMLERDMPEDLAAAVKQVQSATKAVEEMARIKTKGSDGKSAYDLYVEKGGELSLEQWLESLHGRDADIAAAEAATTAANEGAAAANAATASAIAAETTRQQTFDTNETARQNAAQNAETFRNGAYEEAENDRDEEFATNEAHREATFNANEAGRTASVQAAQTAAQAAATSAAVAEQKATAIDEAITGIDPSQSTSDAIVAEAAQRAAKDAELEAGLGQLGPKIDNNLGFVYDSKYVNSGGSMTSDENWLVIEYTLSSAVAEGDVFVWNGIEAAGTRNIGFYNGNTFISARSATGASRTFTIASGEVTIGANKIRASFLKSRRNEATLTRNGVLLDPLARTRITALEESVAATDAKTFVGQFSMSNIDNVKTVGTYIRNKTEAQYANTLLMVHKDSVNTWQLLISPDSPHIQMRTLTNNVWGSWEQVFLPYNQIDSTPTENSNYPIKSGGVYTAIQAINSAIGLVRNSSSTAITIPTMERGTIHTMGTDYSNDVALRTPMANIISVSNKQILVWGYINKVAEYAPDAANFMMNIHCYDANGTSLGRTTAGWADIKNGYVYQLKDNTAKIRIAVSFQKVNNADITLTDEQATALISAMSGLVEIADYTESLSQLRQSLFGIKKNITDADDTPKEGSNNLVTSGGVFAALNGGVTATQHLYFGMPIQLRKRQRFNSDVYMAISKTTGTESGQGCVNYGSKLLVGGAGGYIRVFDLESKENLGDVELASAADDNHVNNICFGVEGDANNTVFPKYLYVSECNGDANNQNRCFVENFSLDSSTLVQTITYSDVATALPGGCEWVVDTDNGYIYAVGLTVSNPFASNAKIGIKKFALPKISDGTSVQLSNSNVLDSWEYDATFGYMYIFQGAYYFDGKIFLCTGGYDNGTTSNMPHRIFVISLLDGSVQSVIDMGQIKKAEIESCCVYNGKLLCCYTNQQQVISLAFD